MRVFDEDEAKRLNAEKWQLDLLDLNPEYTCWGPHEDYMWTKDDAGWNSRQIRPTWSEFGPWELDDLNECVNFYFSVTRESKECETCGGNGYHPKAQEIADSYYDLDNRGTKWVHSITQDEVQALVDAGRLIDFTHQWKQGEGWKKKEPPVVPTAEEVNSWARKGMGHDAINRHILIRTRLKRLGLPETCPTCDGHGYVYTAPSAHVSLTLWWLHPRKGCSRGIEVTRIEQAELPVVFAFLREAADRNAQRFSKIPGSPPAHGEKP